jgi:predicted nucleic acid-binding protein
VRFWDSSAIAPLILHENSSPTTDALYRNDPDMLVWWATRAELLSAVARRVREGLLQSIELDAAIARIDRIWGKAAVLDPEPAILEQTQRLLFAYPLRASDALQLAAAVAVVHGRPEEIQFVSLDHRLRSAAAAEGFAVLPL